MQNGYELCWFLTSGVCKVGLQEIKQAYLSLSQVWMKVGLYRPTTIRPTRTSVVTVTETAAET